MVRIIVLFLVYVVIALPQTTGQVATWQNNKWTPLSFFVGDSSYIKYILTNRSATQGTNIFIQKDSCGYAVGTNTAIGLNLENTTVATASLRQNVPRIRLAGRGWNGSASVTQDWIISGDVQVNNNPEFQIYRGLGGSYSKILGIDAFGQWGTAFKFNTWNNKKTYTDAISLGDDFPSTSTDTVQFAPQIRLRSKGWNSTTSAPNYAAWSISSQPTSGSSVTANLVFRYIVDPSSSTPSIEAMRLQNGMLGIGTTTPQGVLDIVSTTGALIVPRMTTTQRDALNAVNGMIIYNTTTNQFNFREGGGWVLK